MPDGFDLARPESEDFSISDLSDDFPIRRLLKYHSSGDNIANNSEWERWLLNVLQNRLSQYATSLDEDKNLLRRSEGINKRSKIGVEVRIGEKDILTQAIDKLRHVENSTPETERPKKRLKT